MEKDKTKELEKTKDLEDLKERVIDEETLKEVSGGMGPIGGESLGGLDNETPNSKSYRGGLKRYKVK